MPWAAQSRGSCLTARSGAPPRSATCGCSMAASPQPPAAKKRRLSASDQPPSSGNAEAILAEENLLSASLRKLPYPDTVTHIYDPVSYAVQTHTNFLTRFASGTKKVLFLGMNPGPFGMAQNGVG